MVSRLLSLAFIMLYCMPFLVHGMEAQRVFTSDDFEWEDILERGARAWYESNKLSGDVLADKEEETVTSATALLCVSEWDFQASRLNAIMKNRVILYAFSNTVACCDATTLSNSTCSQAIVKQIRACENFKNFTFFIQGDLEYQYRPTLFLKSLYRKVCLLGNFEKGFIQNLDENKGPYYEFGELFSYRLFLSASETEKLISKEPSKHTLYNMCEKELTLYEEKLKKYEILKPLITAARAKAQECYKVLHERNLSEKMFLKDLCNNEEFVGYNYSLDRAVKTFFNYVGALRILNHIYSRQVSSTVVAFVDAEQYKILTQFFGLLENFSLKRSINATPAKNLPSSLLDWISDDTKTCSFCFTKEHVFYECRQCGVPYCSNECCESDREYHKEICGSTSPSDFEKVISLNISFK